MKKFLLILIIAFTILTFGCFTRASKITKVTNKNANNIGKSASENKDKIAEYYPFIADRCLDYKGVGNEYAGMKVWVEYIKNNKIQIKNINGGTDVEQVIENKNGELRLIYSKEEFYFRLDVTRNTNMKTEILLKEPIVVGTSWKIPSGEKRYISGKNVSVKTKLGNYKCIEVTTQSTNGKTLQYYEKGIGLIKTVFSSKEGEVSSELEKITNNKPIEEIIKLYYPDYDKSRNVYIEQSINLKTNEAIKGYFEKFLKHPPMVKLPPVIGKDVKINELTLNIDKHLVHVDFSKELISEMNAGVVLESMILTCITNTLASYYNAEKVYITIEGKPYSSGHVLMKLNEPFIADYKNTIEYK